MSKTTTEFLLIKKTQVTEPDSPRPQTPESPRPPPRIASMPAVEEKSPVAPSSQTKKPFPADSEATNGVESLDGESEAPTTNPEEEGQEQGQEGQEGGEEQGQEGEEGEDDEGTEVVPLGSVDAQHQVVDDSGNVVGKVGEDVPEGSMVDTEGDVLDAEGNVLGKADLDSAAKEGEEKAGEAKEGLEGAAGEATEGTEKPEGAEEALDEAGKKKEGVEGEALEAAEGVEKPEIEGPFGVQDNGEITNAKGLPIGKLVEGDPKDLVGRSIHEIDDEGQLLAEGGSVLGKVELSPEVLEKGDEAGKKKEGVEGEALEAAEGVEKPEIEGPFDVQDNGEVTNAKGLPIGKLVEGDPKDLQGGRSIHEINDEGQLLAEGGSVLGKVEFSPEVLEKGREEAGEGEETKPLDPSILDGLKVNKLGKVVKEDGTPVGQLVEGEAKKLAGKKCDAEGKIWNDSGKVIGRAEPLPEAIEEPSAPFEDFPDAVVDAKGNVLFEGRIIGKIVEGDAKKLEGKKIDADGDILDKHGNTLGKAERVQEEEPEPEPEAEPEDLSELEGKRVNKAGNVVDDNGKLVGRVNSGVLSKLIGKKCDKEGKIYSDSGKVIGTAELIPADDREGTEGSPFDDFPDAVVDSKGNILFEGQVVGKLIEGDPKKLAGKKIDKDGEVVDKVGNVLGKAERWIEPDEPEPEKIDMSLLGGKRVNKLGNLVDSSGQIFGRLVSGDPKKLAGKMCDKEGNIRNEMGDIIGKAELVPEAEREGAKTGPFADIENPTVVKDGKVADSKGTIIGRIIQGDAKALFGKPVDDDGDILDKNGNTLGKAERWEEEEKEVSKHPAFGRKVNKKGEVVDENGDTIAKLTDGDAGKCAGKEVDNDGDVKDQKGMVVGHVTLIEDIPEPEEPKESEEEIAARKEAENDRKLAGQLASCIEQSIDKIKPILKMIEDTISAAEAQPKEDLDEQKLVDTVKPLIEEGGQILQECNGAIRALDPDGRIQSQAKAKASSRDASPEEYRLAEQLKELAASVQTTIDRAKKKIAGMPHAKKELNPLWALLAEPLGQIIAAVGLLLSGVLGLVGRLLSGLGLGGLLDNLLGGLGLKGILSGLGLGVVTDSLTGKKKK